MFLAVLAGLQQLTNTFDRENAVKVFGERIKQPGIHNFEAQSRTQVAQDYSNIRAPFGGNELYQKTVADPNFMLNDQYQRNYQLMIKNVKIDTEEARLPNARLMGEENKFTCHPHIPEGGISKIANYRSRRAFERGFK